MRSPIAFLLLSSTVAVANVHISSYNLPTTGKVNVAYSGTVTAKGGCLPYTWTTSGTLPPGLNVIRPAQTTTQTLQINGTPTTAGTYPFTVQVMGCGHVTSKVSATVAISPATLVAPVITSAVSANATAGQAFAYQITATNSPTSFGASGLPGGLIVNATTGKISGTPTTAGTYYAQVSATNASGTGAGALTITVVDSVPIAHTVSLDWTAPTTPYVYFSVYRGTQSGGPWSQIATSIASPPYIDSNVASGTTYFYVVTDTDNTGAESVYSNQAQAVVPTP